MMLKPLSDFVLLKEEEAIPYHAFKEFQHIITPDVYSHGPEDRPVWGEVAGFGDSCRRVIQIGNRVLIGKWSGARITYQSIKYILVKEDDILAVDGGTDGTV